MRPPVTGRQRLTLHLNGTESSADVDARALLVDALRDGFGISGVRTGCANGDCGTCTAMVNGTARKTCLILAHQAEGAQVTTLEGLARDNALHPVQQAFAESYAFQCGFCLPGMIFSAIELLAQEEQPDEPRIRGVISGNLCRCTGYHNIVVGVRRAAELGCGAPPDPATPADDHP
jgi:aerobic-type carbon monoxide dehydrogenase small subunit (CoxS/CutS family)